jgi:hypothetical protein
MAQRKLCADARVRLRRQVDNLGALYEGVVRGCDSPVEQMFLAEALNAWPIPTAGRWPPLAERLRLFCAPARACFSGDGDSDLWVHPRLRTEGRTYWVDFAIVGPRRRLAIELDGHEFHERTPEQATADKARDRALLAAGWPVIRFTGREVNANPGECVDQVLHCFLAKEG